MKESKKLISNRLKSKQALDNEKGLTIIETIIALSIFSFLIIVSMGVFIFVGRIYYKGLYENATQTVTRNIVDNVAEALRTSGNALVIADETAGDGWKAYCIGNVQYSYKENIQLVAEDDLVPGGSGRQSDKVFIATNKCNIDRASGAYIATPLGKDPGPPSDPPDPKFPTEVIELLHDRMRVLEFSIERIGENLYEISLKIALGGNLEDLAFDKTVFEYVDDMDMEIDPEDPAYGSDFIYDTTSETTLAEYFKDIEIKNCQSIETFCAIMELRTKAYRKIL